MGRIQDRTQEHLGKTDVGIIHYRRMLRAAIQALEDGDEGSLPMRNGKEVSGIRGPISIDAIGAANQDWQEVWRTSDKSRRDSCEWDASL